MTCRPGAVGFDSWPERAMNTVEDPSLPSRVAKQLPQQLEGTIDQSEEMERSRLLTITTLLCCGSCSGTRSTADNL